LFNRLPQSRRLGITSTGDYIFLDNVVLEELRLINYGLFQAHYLLGGG